MNTHLYTHLRCWRRDIRFMDTASIYYRAQILVAACNFTTDPVRLWTDREARTVDRFGRWARKRLDRLDCQRWFVAASGLIWMD